MGGIIHWGNTLHMYYNITTIPSYLTFDLPIVVVHGVHIKKVCLLVVSMNINI